MRPLLFFPFLFLSACVFTGCTHDTAETADPWTLVPVRSAMVIDLHKGMQGILDCVQHGFFEIPSAFPAGKGSIDLLKQIFPEGEVDDTFPMPREMLLCVAASGADRYDVALIFEPGPMSEKELGRLLGPVDWTESSYSGSRFLKIESDSAHWFLTAIEGNWFLTSSRLLLEETIRKGGQEEEAGQSEGLIKLIGSADEGTDMTLFLQVEEMRSLWRHWFERSQLSSWNGIDGWMAFDLVLGKDRFYFSGIVNRTEQQMPKPLQKTINHEFEKQDFIPASAALWSTKRLNTADLQQPIGPLSELSSWFDERRSCGAFFLPDDKNGQYLSPVFFLGVLETDPRSILSDFQTDVASTELFRAIEIIHLNRNCSLDALFTYQRFSTDCDHFCIIDGRMYLSASPDRLKQTINELQTGEHLEGQFGPSPEEFYPSGDANRHMGFQNPGLAHVLMHFVNGKGMPSLANGEKAMGPIRSGGISLLQRGEWTYIKGSLNSGSPKNKPVRNTWTASLESEVIAGPFDLASHRGGPRAFLVQDSNYVLYLLDTKGGIDWRVQLDGIMLGTPYAIDRYKNGKLQYVLNTAGSLYGFDRLGNALDGFPVDLDPGATAGLSVFDYDEVRKYRILVPCGPQVFNFDEEGNAVSGWAFEPMATAIVRSPILLQSGGKDFLCFQSEDGMRLTSRAGKRRWKEDLELALSPENTWWAQDRGNPKLDGFTGLNARGKLVHIFTDGNIDSSMVTADWFRLFEGNGIRYEDGILEFQTPNTTREIRKEAKWERIRPLKLEGQFLILALDDENNKLHLFNIDGREVDGFPVYGDGDWAAGDFFSSGRLNIVVAGSGGSLIHYEASLSAD